MKKFGELTLGEKYTIIAPNGEEGGTVYMKISGDHTSLNTETYTPCCHNDDIQVHPVEGFFEIVVEQGNGYHCDCCHRTYEETYEYRTLEAVIDRLCRIEAECKHPTHEDEDDIEVNDVKRDGVSIYTHIGELPQSLIDKYCKAKLEIISEQKKLKNEAQRESDLKELAALKAKYPDANPDF